MKFSVLLLSLLLVLSTISIPLFKVSAQSSILADLIYQRASQLQYNTSDTVQATQYGIIFAQRPTSDYDVLAQRLLATSDWDTIIRLKRAAEVSGYDSSIIDDALRQALLNIPMVGALPITWPEKGGYLVYQGYEMYGYKYAEQMGITRWDKNAAFQQLANLIDTYGGGFLIAHVTTAEYAAQNDTRYYDEQAEVIRDLHILEEIGVSGARTYEDKIWNHLLNDGWWTGQWFWYRPSWQCWECEMGGFASIISDYLGLPPQQVLSDVYYKLLQNGWNSYGWMNRYVINHAEYPNGTQVTNELRPGETVAVWRALQSLYPYMNSTMQNEMTDMLNARVWSLMYNTSAFGGSVSNQLNGLMAGLLMGVVPKTASLDTGFNEEMYVGNDIEFPSNQYGFDYTNHQITIPVKNAGSIDFLFGTGSATATFPAKGKYVITFSSDWNTVLSVTRAESRTIVVPDDYPTIQAAINAAKNGDTIFVNAGIYSELVVVNKTVSLIGQNVGSTVIDGNFTGAVVTLVTYNVTVSGFTIRNGYTIQNSGEGVFLDDVSGCKIIQNNITGNGDGIFGYGDYNSISDNFIFGNQLRGIDLGWFGHDLMGNDITRNVIDGNSYFGIQMVYGSKNIVMQNNISDQNVGLELYGASSQQNAVCDNIFHSNGEDIYLYGLPAVNGPSNNTIAENTLETILIQPGEDNRIFHNNFLAGNPVIICDGNNTWDDGYPSGGNYWSDYNGTDSHNGPYQNETGSDGIGDAPYTIDASNLDNYPLMNPWAPPDIAVSALSTSKTVIGQGYTGTVNVTFENQGNKIEAFNVTVYANSTIIYSEQIMLAMTNATLSFKWNTTGFAYGNYTITAFAEHLPEEMDISNNNFTCAISVHVGMPGDVSGSTVGVYNRVCDMKDIAYLIVHFMGKPSNGKWDPNADVNDDNVINMRDIAIAVYNFNHRE